MAAEAGEMGGGGGGEGGRRGCGATNSLVSVNNAFAVVDGVPQLLHQNLEPRIRRQMKLQYERHAVHSRNRTGHEHMAHTHTTRYTGDSSQRHWKGRG